MSAADIARLAGVGRAAVSNWRRRHPDFPQPVGGTPASPLFALSAIETWLRHQGKLQELPLEERAWQRLRAEAGDDLRLAEVLAAAGEDLVRRARAGGGHGAGETGAADPGPATADARPATADMEPGPAEAATTEARRARPGAADAVSGSAGAVSGAADAGSGAAASVVARFAAERGAVPAFEFLYQRYRDVQPRRGAATATELAELMVALTGGARTVLDPACGGGELLLAALARAATPPRLLGQDTAEGAARLAAVRLALHGADATVATADALRHDAFPGARADAVLCDPPFHDRLWGHEELASDPRWEYGFPPRLEPELAWVQHALAHLAPGGRAVVLMPAVAAGRRSGRRIRARLLRRGALRAVMALPAGHHLWVLERPGPGAQTTTVLMIDNAEPDTIAGTWRAWGNDPEHDEPGVSRAVPVIDLLDEDVDLTPARHLSAAGSERTAQRFSGTRDRLAVSVGRLGDLVPDVGPAADPQEPQTVPVAELVRIGHLVIHQTPLRGEDPQGDGAGEPLLTAEDVIEGRPASGRALPDDARTVAARTGDVVVATDAQRLVSRVVEHDGVLLGHNLTLLRPDPGHLDPYFLAGVLRSTTNARLSAVASTGSTGRTDVRRARVPRLPPAEQRRYGAAFRRMAAFESALRSTADLGAEMAQLLADGVTAGTLTSAPPRDDGDAGSDARDPGPEDTSPAGA